LIHVLGSIYSAVAVRRRQWYARAPARRRRLSRPVISVGNLSVGGSGKTPVVRYVASLLLDQGERPAILTRGYGRRHANDDPIVVSDGITLKTGIDSSGDEPLMLARQLPGVAVVVGASRYRAGRLAEEQLGATVHLLDDGFQHVQLERTVNLLLLGEDDLEDQPLPAGRLREPLDVSTAADAVLVRARDDAGVERVARAIGVRTAFRVSTALGAPHTVGPQPAGAVVPPGTRVLAVAGIARPERFFADLTAAGWDLAGAMRFRDHHRFTASDVSRIAAAARASGAASVLTTEKDAVRLEPFGDLPVPLVAVPLVVGIQPADRFREWLLARIRPAQMAFRRPAADPR
jgi:tetraacyldisaccharide 4'-kinase